MKSMYRSYFADCSGNMNAMYGDRPVSFASAISSSAASFQPCLTLS